MATFFNLRQSNLDNRLALANFWDDSITPPKNEKGKPIFQKLVKKGNEFISMARISAEKDSSIVAALTAQHKAQMEVLKAVNDALERETKNITSIDIKLAGAVVVLVASSIIASVGFPLFGTLAIIAFGYAIKLWTERNKAYGELTLARENAEVCLAWTLGEGLEPEIAKGNGSEPQVQRTADLLMPLLTETEMTDILDDDFEKQALENARQVNDNQIKELRKNNPLFDKIKEEDHRTWTHVMYGKNQGNMGNVAWGAMYIVRSAWKNWSKPVNDETAENLSEKTTAPAA